jgi:hypothetical protein
MACNCPPGYILLPDGITCEKVVYETPLPPSQILKASDIAENPGLCGLLVYENVTSNQDGGTKQWPIISSPQNGNYFTLPFTWNSLSVIPDVGPNWTSIFPSNSGPSFNNVHAPVTTPLPSPYPPVSWPSLPAGSCTDSLFVKPLRESVVTSNVLNYGTGNLINVTNFSNSGAWNPSILDAWIYRKSVWTTPSEEYKSLGYTWCINVSEEKQYYILISASNSFYIYINDQLAVECNTTDGATLGFNFINAFPITLKPGLNTIYLQGYNFAGGGALSADILDISLSQLLSASDDIFLEPFRIFSTKWKRPRLIYITGNGTTTATLTPLVVQPALQEYDLLKFLNTTIGIPTGTFIVGFPDIANGVMLLNQPIAPGTYTIELYSTYDLRENNIQWGCPEGTTFCGASGCSQILTEPCTPGNTFYELTDCSGSANVVTCTDLSDYLGMVIKLKSCPDICWKVGTTAVCNDPKIIDINDIIGEYPSIAVGTTCVYDIDEAVDTRAIPAGCIASVVIYINGIPYTFPYTTPENLVALINTLGLGNAVYVEN